jgi:hypothetical protein
MIYAQAQIPSEDVMSLYSKLGLVVYRVEDPEASLVIGDVPGTVAAFGEPTGGSPGMAYRRYQVQQSFRARRCFLK